MDSTSARPLETEPPRGERRSTHFQLRFPPASVAERDAPRIEARLEALCQALSVALELPDLGVPPIRVSLGEVIDHAEPSSIAGDFAVRDGQIRGVYRSDAPGKGLERALVELALQLTAGAPLDGAPWLVDGLLGHVSEAIDKLPVTADDAVRDLMRQSDRPPATALLAPGASAAPLTYYPMVTSLVRFLLSAQGPTRLKALARALAQGAPDAAFESAYGAPLATIEQAWLESLRANKAQAIPGITMLIRRAATYLRPYWKQEALVLLATLVAAGYSIVEPLAFRWIIDRAIIPGNFRLLGLLLGGLGILFVIQAVASLGREYLNARVAANVLSDMRLQLFTHLQRLSMGFYSRAQVGDIMSRLSSDLFAIQGAMTGMLVQLIYLAVTVVASTVLLLWLQWQLALLALVISPLVLLGQKLFGTKAMEASYQEQQEIAAVASVLQENLGAQSVVKVFGLEESATATFRESVGRLTVATVRSTFIGALFGMTAQLTVALIQLVTMGVGAFMVMKGHLSLGGLLAFTSLLGNVLGPMQGFSGLLQGLQQATGGMRRIDELLGEGPQVVDAQGASPLAPFGREIRFSGVSFSYTGDQTNLKDVNLAITAGQKVAFVGPSGCGKSTLLSLILRLYDPIAGTVTLDGRDLRTVTQASLRNQLATVLQDTFLFNASVRDNIRIGRPGASDTEVEAAAKAAEIHELITSLPESYDTIVGERGSRLSGGQRQRIAIARAILRNAPVLLLDEATSALDSETEAAINATLVKVMKDRTTIAVTHRLASAARADCIFVLDRGELVQHGTHDALVAQEGLYQRLWQQQSGATLAGQEPLEPDVARLSAVPFFSELDGVMLAALASRLQTEHFTEGAIVFREGDPGDKLYIVVTGQVEVVTVGPTGAERRLATLRRGDYFGEIALLRDATRSATARARESTVLVSLDRAQVDRLLRSAPELRAAFDRVVEARTLANRAAIAS
jgi:ATP-binding cassette subfamily B protein